MRITKEEMVAATGTPQETSTRLTWTLQCYADMELKQAKRIAEIHRLREALTDIESIAGNIHIGAPAACMRVADIAKRALDRA
jgi:hypothetical protein